MQHDPEENLRAYYEKLRAGYIVCAVFQCEEPPVWRAEDGTLLCELHKPDDEDDDDN